MRFSKYYKNSFSSELKCLHYSNTNRRNYNNNNIIIHLGLSSVQYNNKQSQIFKILLLETPFNVKCIFTELGTVQLPVFSPPRVSFSSLLSVSRTGTLQPVPILQRQLGDNKYFFFFLNILYGNIVQQQKKGS